MLQPRRLLLFVLSTLFYLSLFSQSVFAASSWGFADATVSVTAKAGGVGGGLKEKLVERKALSQSVVLGSADTLKLSLTTQDGRSSKKAHQTFLLLRDPTSNLDVSYPFSIKENGKAKVDLSQKDIPLQLLRSTAPLDASIVIGSFGSAKAYNEKAFTLSIESDPNTPTDTTSKPVRYGKRPEINHIFRSDPKSPNVLLSLIFSGAVSLTIPILLGVWAFLGGNFNHLSAAFQKAPGAHALFFGSILSMEGVFFLYYTSWNLFQTLPVIFGIGVVTFLSGSRALTEVQQRRLAGLR